VAHRKDVLAYPHHASGPGYSLSVGKRDEPYRALNQTKPAENQSLSPTDQTRLLGRKRMEDTEHNGQKSARLALGILGMNRRFDTWNEMRV